MKSSAVHDRAHSLVPSRPVALLVGLFAAVLVLPLLSGCPGALGPGTYPDMGGGMGSGGMTGTGTGGTTVACTDAVTQVIQRDKSAGGCLASDCHTSLFPPKLAPGMLDKEMLKTLKGTSFSGPCIDQPLINTANPSASVLLKKVLGTECGTQMPFGLPALSQADKDCIAAWVAAP
jgi:hypothetical protein